jgi:hypothetical protein
VTAVGGSYSQMTHKTARCRSITLDLLEWAMLHELAMNMVVQFDECPDRDEASVMSEVYLEIANKLQDATIQYRMYCAANDDPRYQATGYGPKDET